MIKEINENFIEINENFIEDIIENSSIIAVNSYNIKVREIKLDCKNIFLYLKNKNITPRYLGTFIYLLNCSCDFTKYNIYIYENFLEYIKLLISYHKNDFENYLSMNVTPKLYLKYGIIAIMASPIIEKNTYKIKGFIEDLISLDIVHKFPFDEETIYKIIKRVEYLKNNKAMIWALFLEDLYRD